MQAYSLDDVAYFDNARLKSQRMRPSPAAIAFPTCQLKHFNPVLHQQTWVCFGATTAPAIAVQPER